MDKGKKNAEHMQFRGSGRKGKLPRKLLVSVISFVLVAVLFVSMSFSWFTITTSELEAGKFDLNCGKGLRVNDSGTSQLSFNQNKDSYLIPASSVDGRNLYFPTDGSDFSSVTEFMTFRSANAGDKNKNYIQIDFTLTAQQNHTALYINEEKTSIKVRNHSENNTGEYTVAQAASLRSALWSSTEENGEPNTPIVFNPTSRTVYTAAVEDVDRSSGAFISSGRQVAHAFSDYSFGGLPVATLSRNVKTKFSYIIWLEGADPKCSNSIVSKDIEICLAFSTSWDKTQTIRFEDQTVNQQIKNMITRENNPYRLSLVYEEQSTSADKPGSMTEFKMYSYNGSDKCWSCNIPGDMRGDPKDGQQDWQRGKIYFILRPVSGNGTVYTFTKDYNEYSKSPQPNPIPDTYYRGVNRLYVAKLLNETTPGESCGYWRAIGDSDGTGHDSGNLDGDDF